MRPAGPLLLLAVSLLACHPDVAGRCTTDSECRPGVKCDTANHLCSIKDTSKCVPDCTAGQACLSGICTAGVPTVGLVVAAGAVLSPSKNSVQVNITNGAGLRLGSLTVQAANASGGAVVASGSLPVASVGDSVVALAFTSTLQGPGNLVAILSFTDPAGAPAEVRSPTIPAELDSQGPDLQSVTVLDATDTVGGWTPRVPGGTLTVAAAFSEGTTGSGLDTATLTIDGCSAPSCSFSGVLGTVAQGAGTFRFNVPRLLQAAGSEAKLAFTVKALDKAGNGATGAGALQLDDAPPTIGAGFTLVTSGTTGEDGNTWFAGGARGKDVELAVPLTDSGAGLLPSSLVLTLAALDIAAGASSTVPGFLPAPPDGTVHFKIPTGRVVGREGKVHFTLAAQDKLGHASSTTQSEARVLWVDDLPPVVTIAAADYTSASPSWSAVCGQLDSTNSPSAVFHCGRGPSDAPDHALRDDVLSATFTVLDCGSGTASGSWQLASGGQLSASARATANSTVTSGNCANGSLNKTRSFTASIDLSVAAPVLAPPSSDGTSDSVLFTTGADKAGATAITPNPPTQTGHLLISRVRWRALLSSQPAGSPALVWSGAPSSSSGARSLAVPLKAGSTATKPRAVEIFDSSGRLSGSIAATDSGVPVAAATDLVAGSEKALWFATPMAGCASLGGNCSRLWISAPVSAAYVAASCDVDTGALGALAIHHGGTLTSDQLVSATTAAPVTEQAALWQATFSSNTPGCKANGGALFVPGAPPLPFSGVVLGGGQAFFSSVKGFFSTGLPNGSGGFGVTPTMKTFVDTASTAVLVLPAAPSLGTIASAPVPFFGAQDTGDAPSRRSLRRAATAPGSTAGCGGIECWIPAPGFFEPQLGAALSHTPVHDASLLFAVDDAGSLYAFDQSGSAVGHAKGVPAIDAGDYSKTKPQPVSPPVLLGSATQSPRQALVQQADGLVQVITPISSSALPVLQVEGLATGRPEPPLIDLRGSGGVAYLIDGGAWVWALQLDAPPLQASATAWPRPSRDTCNSRSLESSCP